MRITDVQDIMPLCGLQCLHGGSPANRELRICVHCHLGPDVGHAIPQILSCTSSRKYVPALLIQHLVLLFPQGRTFHLQ